MGLITITYDEVMKVILLSFAENLEAFLSLFKDTRYLMNNCIEQKGNVITLSESVIQNYIDYHRTIPMLVTVGIEGNMKRIEYAFNYVLGILQKELAEECKQIEELHSLQQEEEFERLAKKTDEIIQNAYNNELSKIAQLDLYAYKKEHSSGFYYNGDLEGGK